MRAIENGAWNDSIQKPLNELEAQQAALRQQLQAAASLEPVVRLHSNAAALYAAKVADLQAALNQQTFGLRPWRYCALIDRIVLTPDETAPNGLALEPFGDLATILNLASSTGPALVKSARAGQAKTPGLRGFLGLLFQWLRGHETNLICCCRDNCRSNRQPLSDYESEDQKFKSLRARHFLLEN